MLPELSAPAWSEIDVEVFDRLVKPDHYVRRALELMDFERFRPILAPYYSPDQGRPAEEPVRMLKLEFLQYYDTLSDRQVVDRGQTDMAYRYFLGLGLDDELPHPSSLCVFRGRIGVEGHRAIFNELIAQAREHGLVRDRLRLKDATHVIADVAIPSTLALIAQVRNKLLGAVEPFDALRAEGERARAEMIRTSTDGRPNEERLAARVTHLREILAWVDELASPADGEESRVWQTLVATRGLAHKILADQDPAQKGDRTRSTVDPDARCGKHGSWYDGYLLDVMMDADSELITAVEMLPANGNEAADAAELVRQEEQAQGNDVEALSIDGVGFQGPVLRELEDPEGLDLDVYVPPKKEPTKGRAAKMFATTDFVEDPERGVVTCPAGHTSVHRARSDKHAWVYRFDGKQCATCPLLDRCINKPANRLGRFGRTVRKNDYQAEYLRARQKANTAEYQAVRAEHPKIERKLSELVRRHGIRRARYRGRWKVVIQALITATVTNAKRVVHLLDAPATLPDPT